MVGADDSGPATLTSVAEEAQRALRARPSLSIRTRLTVGLLVWFALSLGITVVSSLLVGRVQEKLRMVGAVDRYTFEIQQARRFEKNYFLYNTNLGDALDQVHAAQRILDREIVSMASVVGEESVQAMRSRVERYEELLAGLPALNHEADTLRMQEVEAELRVHGATMVSEAEDLATGERESVEALLRMSQRIAMAFLVVLLVVIVALSAFVARQMLAPLSRMVEATRRIAGGDLTPITPRRRYHDEFSELAEAINHMTHELVRRQQLLVQSHKLQAIGTLTAGVAHELNNPINNLMLTAAALEESWDEMDDAEKQELAADLVGESERARDIVRNLLDFARETEVELAPLEVEQIVGDTLQLASNQVRLAKVRVRGEVEENLPPVHGDRHQLTQVFLNLVLNALDAMPGGGTLTITVEKSGDGNFVDIGFTDTGVGIAEQHLPHIFDPFFSTKKHARGTGLGLSVSLGIIKQHGGDMRVRSEEGRGATFTVALPVARVPAKVGGS
ncbi:MAG TPA: ATP-binding protein [Longimicrobiales bacterium]|nr:ATP-binding protein [Longimicrobiales bacterium]